MNDVMRAVVCIPGLFSILEQFPPAHSRKTLYRHAEYATEHTTAYVSLTTRNHIQGADAFVLSRLSIQSQRKDFMYHILNANGPAATPKEIASHYNVIMMAGAVTTATFLSGVLYYLGINRQALGKLQNEVRSVFSDIEAIHSKNLLSCIYLNAVVEEGLRIYPPAGAAHLSRIVPKGGCEISGSFIPEGVGLSSSNQNLLTLIFTYRPASRFIPGPFCEIRPISTNPHSSFRSAGSEPPPKAKRAIS